MSFSNDGKFIVSGSYDTSVRCWRVKDEIMIWGTSAHTMSSFQDAIINGIQGVDPESLLQKGAKYNKL